MHLQKSDTFGGAFFADRKFFNFLSAKKPAYWSGANDSHNSD